MNEFMCIDSIAMTIVYLTIRYLATYLEIVSYSVYFVLGFGSRDVASYTNSYGVANA